MINPVTNSLAERCRQKGLRITGPRRVILRVLDRAKDHPDVEELHRRVSAIEPGINIATVYRTMNILAEHGLIERHSFSDGRARYEAVPEEHHDHFINVETGQVIEFRSDEIERIQQEIAHQYGFDIVSHRLEIYVRPTQKNKK
ncbi:transcriptional repressor [Aureimonas fodinaquatilis]|uniref:Ferric uptake regulation protein n=1 Tax=Aureimonas fodinaquatilis TaxID=2565783 RepID=A0A5B0DZX9_9HYPH|nr:Fur family transcriptional regulator [Aureimonas fodinaquatilis]KAA0972354.1 transcriptional repressor [Aureimonas fodinaquatilis]